MIVAAIDEQPDPSSWTLVKLNVIKPQDYGIHVPGPSHLACKDLVRDQPVRDRRCPPGPHSRVAICLSRPRKERACLAGAGPAGLNSERLRHELQQQRELVLSTGGRIGDYDESRWRTLRDIRLLAKLGEEGMCLWLRRSTTSSFGMCYRRSPDLAAPGALGLEK